jgi:16S rRNA (cytosine1402-N4)-methyltransferase
LDMLPESRESKSHHIPILLEPITRFLREGIERLPKDAPPGVIIDCTLGGGGHSSALLRSLETLEYGRSHRVIGIDRDPEALARNQVKFETEIQGGRMELHALPFSRAIEAAAGRPVYGLLADLGISSDQIDSESRGFSFRFPAPLDMRMNPNAGIPLSEWLGTVGESELADVLWKYGEERLSRKIARRLVDLRGKGRLPTTTLELADAIASVFPPPMRHRGIHPATRSFQALRIEINEEMRELETLIAKVFPAVAPGGRIAILSFHSLEDRLVKEAFKQREFYEPATKKPLQAGEQELEANPRSRSAKLRLAERKPGPSIA